MDEPKRYDPRAVVTGMQVVMAGDLRRGFDVYGPFNNALTAAQWANASLDEEWEVMPVQEASIRTRP